MKKYRSAIGAVFIGFAVLAFAAILNYFQTSTKNVGFMDVSRIQIINARFIIGNDTLPDQLRIALQNLEVIP